MVVRDIGFLKPLDKLSTRMEMVYLNSDMMVGSGQPRSSTSSTVEFWSENEKQRFTCDFDHFQLSTFKDKCQTLIMICLQLTFIPNLPSGWEMWALQRFDFLADSDFDEHGDGKGECLNNLVLIMILRKTHLRVKSPLSTAATSPGWSCCSGSDSDFGQNYDNYC